MQRRVPANSFHHASSLPEAHHQISCHYLDHWGEFLKRSKSLRPFEEFTSTAGTMINDLKAADGCLQIIDQLHKRLFLILDQFHRYLHRLLQLHREPQHDCWGPTVMISLDSHMKKHPLAWGFTWHRPNCHSTPPKWSKTTLSKEEHFLAVFYFEHHVTYLPPSIPTKFLIQDG